MMRRNGGMAKVIAGVCVFFVGVYLFYLYYDVSGRLKQTERTAERYRREGETAAAQLQDVSMAKSELQQRCDTDKQEFTNRLNSLQQQYKMLKSQHEDMENDYSKLQNERETEQEQQKKIEEERNIEYNKFKQEKLLEVSSLKDTVANLEREKQEMTEEISKLKEQLQNNLKQVLSDKQNIAALEQQISTQKAETGQDKQTIESLKKELIDKQQQHLADQNLLFQYQSQLTQAQNLLQQQQAQAQQQAQQQQQQIQQAQAVQNQMFQQGQVGLNPQNPNLGLQGQNTNLNNQQPNFQQVPGQQHGFLGQGNRNMFNMPFGGARNNQLQNSWQPMKQQQANNNVVPGDDMKPVVNEGMKMANEMLHDLEDKQKPVDPDMVEQQQQQHQLLPPKDKPEIDYHKEERDKKAQSQDMKQGNEVAEGAGDGDHDGRIENQGPVNLQVQEPNLKPKEEDLKFRPIKPDAVDNQLQPNQPVDDTIKQEQVEVPVHPLAADNNLIHAPDNVDVGARPIQDLDHLDNQNELGPMQDDDKDYNDDDDDDYDDAKPNKNDNDEY